MRKLDFKDGFHLRNKVQVPWLELFLNKVTPFEYIYIKSPHSTNWNSLTTVVVALLLIISARTQMHEFRIATLLYFISIVSGGAQMMMALQRLSNSWHTNMKQNWQAHTTQLNLVAKKEDL